MSGLMAEKFAEKIRGALRGSGRSPGGGKGFESGFLLRNPSQASRGPLYALRRHSWLFSTRELQSDDPFIWLCLVASWTLEPSSKIGCE
jgi:hypothetical protein